MSYIISRDGPKGINPVLNKRRKLDPRLYNFAEHSFKNNSSAITITIVLLSTKRQTNYQCRNRPLVFHSAQGAEPEQADHVDTVVDRGGVRSQLAAANRVHAAGGVPAAPDPVHGHAVQGVRVRAHDGHVDHVHQPAAVRLAEHQLPARHIGHMPADVVLRRPEATAAAQAVPVRGH